MSINDLRFTRTLLSKPVPRGLDVETTLHHFAIVTFWVDPSNLRKHLHPRFEPVCLAAAGQPRRALVSVVTFLDRDFRFVACPWFRGSFGQTNYRAYVQDTQTGEQAAWFFGTCLDSISVAVPRYVWKLPWDLVPAITDRGRRDLRTCRELGVVAPWPPTDMPWNVHECHIRHPDGHTIRVSARLEDE